MICKEYDVITFLIIIVIIHNCNFLKKNFVQIEVMMTVNEREYRLILWGRVRFFKMMSLVADIKS